MLSKIEGSKELNRHEKALSWRIYPSLIGILDEIERDLGPCFSR
jgi:hypothetical protein